MSAETVQDLPTPALIVDDARVEANILRAQAYATAQGVALRPHAKTHKSPDFARRQLDAGAVGVSVAKLGEAEMMLDSGISDVFVANTVMGSDKARRAVALAARARFAIGADHRSQLDELSAAARHADRPLEVMLEVDTGARRGGVDPADAADLASYAHALPGIDVRGVYTYEGYTYGAADVAALVELHQAAQDRMAAVAGRVREVLGRSPVVSMGSTPSLLAEVPLRTEIDEIRPGTYIFLDAAQAALAGGEDRCAAHVLATVVSVQRGRALLDAGSKALTSDARPTGVTATKGYGRLVDHGLVVTRLSEEHGVVEDPAAERLEVGQKVRILPNHVCPVVNLFSTMRLVRGDRVIEELAVAGRGLLV